MADQSTDPHDDKVRSVPLPTDDERGGERVILQENQSPEVARGGGEWPPIDAPPTGPAPGTAAGGDAGRPPRSAGETIDGPPPGTRTQAGRQQDGSAGGDRGPARLGDAGLPEDGEGGEFPPVKDVLDADPVAAGSQSAASDEADQERGATKFA